MTSQSLRMTNHHMLTHLEWFPDLLSLLVDVPREISPRPSSKTTSVKKVSSKLSNSVEVILHLPVKMIHFLHLVSSQEYLSA